MRRRFGVFKLAFYGAETMTIQVGDHLPEATFMTFTADGPAPKTTGEVFKGRTVALFAVPGAFTPTCSARHLPGFVDHAAGLKALGVDLIACASVNDAFVMDAWAKSQNIGDSVLMLADGNGDFTKAVGLELDASKFGMGARSQRYSMVVKDGVVQKLNVEAGGEFRVSAADYMLDQLKA
jgi:peroxiredoxin